MKLKFGYNDNCIAISAVVVKMWFIFTLKKAIGKKTEKLFLQSVNFPVLPMIQNKNK